MLNDHFKDCQQFGKAQKQVKYEVDNNIYRDVVKNATTTLLCYEWNARCSKLTTILLIYKMKENFGWTNNNFQHFRGIMYFLCNIHNLYPR